MDQIMRLRRIAGSDFEIEDRNNGYRHEHAFVKNIRRNGLLQESDLLPDSYGGKFHPRAIPELLSSLPVIIRAVLRGKVTPRKALLHPHKASKEVRRYFDTIESKPKRYELNLYISGSDDDLDGSESRQEAITPEPTQEGSAGDQERVGSPPSDESPDAGGGGYDPAGERGVVGPKPEEEGSVG
jgi:succinate dehydrogenase / fumarate reductase iron-sulfur subunit